MVSAVVGFVILVVTPIVTHTYLIIDPADLQSSPVFSTIGSRGYFFFLLFQQFTVDEVDGTKRDVPHPNKALVLGGDGPWIPFPSHSLVTYLGPKVYMLLLDCRCVLILLRYLGNRVF